MDLIPLKAGDRSLIQAYGDGGFRISERRFEGSVLVLEQSVVALQLDSMDVLDATHLAPALSAEAGLEILLIGCGQRMQPLADAHRHALRKAGIAVETMDTGAACRTFNFLLAEGRRAGALLIAVT
jgi:uncharacterized protein